MNPARKICVVTGSRAEFGLLYWLMQALQKDPRADLQVIVTGMHLSPEFGLTYKQVEEAGLPIHRKVEMLLSSDTPGGIARSCGLGLIGMATAFEDLRPELLVLLGDRFEILSAAIAASLARIPIAHLHGGEVTLGAVDEAFRHAITKMAHLHFTAADEYRRRVIQLGEHPSSVFTVGALGVESVRRLALLSKAELEAELGFRFHEKNIVVTFHPVTLEQDTGEEQLEELLGALDGFRDLGMIFTMPNADTEGRSMTRRIERFVAERGDRSRAFTSLGQLKYLSVLSVADGVVGNSSSGILEAPALGRGTVNIGDRQGGRLRAESVIDCEPQREAIRKALEKLLSPEFQQVVKAARNPYGDGTATEKILPVLIETDLSSIAKKHFFDLSEASYG